MGYSSQVCRPCQAATAPSSGRREKFDLGDMAEPHGKKGSPEGPFFIHH